VATLCFSSTYEDVHFNNEQKLDMQDLRLSAVFCRFGSSGIRHCSVSSSDSLEERCAFIVRLKQPNKLLHCCAPKMEVPFTVSGVTYPVIQCRISGVLNIQN